MIFRQYFLLLSTFLLLNVTAQFTQAEESDFANAALTPFWQAQPMIESMFFIQSTAEQPPSSRFLFKPSKILKVVSATQVTVFAEGRDYLLSDDGRSLTLPPDSRIPFKTQEEMFPLMTSEAPKIARQAGDKSRGIFFDNKAGYHQLQVEVTYECTPNQWQGPVPEYVGSALPNFMKKLRDKRPVKIFLSGDSISEGYNASDFTDATPRCPAYGELFALAVERKFGSPVTFKNFAVGGWQSSQGVQQATDEKLALEKPDLVIIAYGMNDVFRKDAAAYQNNIKQLIDIFRADSPDTEFILIATMLGNVEWGMPMEQFDLYRNALQQLTGQGIVLADLTSIWRELLKHKSFYDLTGNGVNHPNDCGHRFYAQVLMAMLSQN